MAHCLETLLESERNDEANENEDVYRNNLYGEHSRYRSYSMKEYTQVQYDFDNEGEEESTCLSNLMDLVVGTPAIIRCRQDYCKLDDHLCRYREARSYYTGSKAEGLDLPGSDEDYMLIDATILVLQSYEGNEFLSHSKSNVFVMETEYTKPCFTLLRHTGSPISEKVHTMLQPINNIPYLSSYLYVMSHIDDTGTASRVIQGPSLETYNEYSTEGRDHVFCLKCDFWPRQANGWLYRHRPSDWPSEHIIQTIQREGCHLVAVGHPLSGRKEMEWRQSFSLAERTLVWSFNHVQMQCYAFLKILLKELIKPKLREDILCSYFVKTIMFWEAELRPSLFWTAGNLTTCLTHLIRKLYHHVMTGHLRHYFIPAFNLFEMKVKGAAQRKLMGIIEDSLRLDVISVMAQCKSLDIATQFYRKSMNNEIQIMDELDRKLYFMKLKTNMYFIFSIRSIVEIQWKFVCALIHTLDKNNTYFEHVKEYGMIRLTRCLLSNDSFAKYGNKLLYGMYSLLVYSPIRHDMVSRKLCIATWLFLTRNFLKCSNFVSSVLSSIPPYYIYYSNCKLQNKEDQVDMYRDITSRYVDLGRSNQRYLMFDLTFPAKDIGKVPAAIQVELVYCDPKVGVFISPFVYLYYLQFLCYHGLHDYTNRDRALHQLIETVNNDEQGGDLAHIHWSYNIAGHCLWFIGRYSEARDMFVMSVRTTLGAPVDKYNSAWHYLDMITPYV